LTALAESSQFRLDRQEIVLLRVQDVVLLLVRDAVSSAVDEKENSFVVNVEALDDML